MSLALTTNHRLTVVFDCTQTGEIQNLEIREKPAGITDFALHCIKVSACRFMIASSMEMLFAFFASKPIVPVMNLAYAIKTLAPISGIVFGNSRYLFNAEPISNKSEQEKRNSFVLGCVVISTVVASVLAMYPLELTDPLFNDEPRNLAILTLMCILRLGPEVISNVIPPNYGIPTSQGQAMGKDGKISQIDVTLVKSGGGAHMATVYNEHLN